MYVRMFIHIEIQTCKIQFLKLEEYMYIHIICHVDVLIKRVTLTRTTCPFSNCTLHT